MGEIMSSVFLSSSSTSLKQYLQEIKQYPILEEKEEQLLFERMHNSKDVKAAELLVTSHLKLVVKIAYSMKNYNVALLDLINEGSIGLMHAVKKYKLGVGGRLASYATLWIKAYMHEYIIKSFSLVRIGTTTAQKKLFFHLRKAKNKILSLHNKEHLSKEDTQTLAKELSVSPKEVSDMDSRLSGTSSLDAPISCGDDGSELNLLGTLSDKTIDIETSVATSQEKDCQRKMLAQALATLSEREKYIMTKRHLADKATTLDVIAKEYKVSKERIRQIEAAALQKLQRFCAPYARRLSH